MIICYIADGSSIHTQRWLNHFAGLGHEVHLISWKKAPGYHGDIQVHLLKTLLPRMGLVSQYLNFPYWCIQAKNIVASIKPDVIDGHYASIYGFMAACTGFHPLFVTAWGSDVLISAQHNLILRFTTKYGMQKADCVICTSPVVRDEIIKLEIDPHKVHIIVLGGVNTDIFYSMGKNESLRQKLGIYADESVIISTRSLGSIYDVGTLIKAVPGILKEFPNTKFIIAGRGSQEVKLRELADQLHVSQNIKFVGLIPHDQLPVYLSSSDIYVSTSTSDGTSNSLLEAMACKLVPVVSDIPANRFWIKEGENGFLFQVGNYIQLAQKVIHLLKSQPTHSIFGEMNCHLIHSNAEPKIEMAKLEAIYYQSIGPN